ncbi:hypothetical protein POM88_016190 [Heracleum sosnowskyi]|uniref:Zinc knuckle CX2CX4HX4C domain-containing protein n=1 Tax=Heracleum sosnowskyi TaxID=360622 RepID=A0AAD8ILJ1_9APIA|nr:hypothetical protein POM88_016190 [Heracleum sosnowskyi]
MCREATGRLSFAKLLIEVDVDKPLPDSLTVIIPNEDGVDPIEVTVRVEYPWRPSWCSQCSIFGHNVQNCPVCVARQEKKIREELEAKKGKQEKEEFIVVHRKGKGKVPSQQGYFQQVYHPVFRELEMVEEEYIKNYPQPTVADEYLKELN